MGAGKHLDATGSLLVPLCMLHFSPKYAYALLGFDALSSLLLPLRYSLGAPYIGI